MQLLYWICSRHCDSPILFKVITFFTLTDRANISKNTFRRYLQGKQFTKDHVRIDGKVVIVTGCNTGIGKETVLELVKRGARVYMACRDEARCEEARQDIIAITGSKNVINRKLDLSSLESVRNFVERYTFCFLN